MVADYGIYGHNFKKGIRIIVQLLFLFSIIVCNMTKHVDKVKALKTMIKESNKVIDRLNSYHTLKKNLAF